LVTSFDFQVYSMPRQWVNKKNHRQSTAKLDAGIACDKPRDRLRIVPHRLIVSIP
jgi:hypothetical protein